MKYILGINLMFRVNGSVELQFAYPDKHAALLAKKTYMALIEDGIRTGELFFIHSSDTDAIGYNMYSIGIPPKDFLRADYYIKTTMENEMGCVTFPKTENTYESSEKLNPYLDAIREDF